LLTLEGADVELRSAADTFRAIERALRTWRFKERPDAAYVGASGQLEAARLRLARALSRLSERDRARAEKLEERALRMRARAETRALRCAVALGIDAASTPAALRALYASPPPPNTRGGTLALRVALATPCLCMGAVAFAFSQEWGLIWLVPAAGLVLTAFIKNDRLRHWLTAPCAAAALGLFALTAWSLIFLRW
jgi:hypothetical protein